MFDSNHKIRHILTYSKAFGPLTDASPLYPSQVAHLGHSYKVTKDILNCQGGSLTHQ